jgi:hypothetical protein
LAASIHINHHDTLHTLHEIIIVDIEDDAKIILKVMASIRGGAKLLPKFVVRRRHGDGRWPNIGHLCLSS